MRLPAIFDHPDLAWNTGIAGTAVLALTATFAGLHYATPAVTAHLLYIPVVLAAYRYPRRGAAIAFLIGGIYLLQVLFLAGWPSILVFEACIRMLVIVAIGGLIAALVLRLREQEDLYQGLFEHSEAGSILVSGAGADLVIERVNWKAADLLKRSVADLKGVSLAAIWNGDAKTRFFSLLLRDQAVYAAETEFVLPDGGTCVVLLSGASLPGNRAILTFFDITDRVRAERALQAANDKLSILSRFATDNLHRSVDGILDILDEADLAAPDSKTAPYLQRVRIAAWNLVRQLFLTESYKDLGTQPADWIDVSAALDSVRLPPGDHPVEIRAWTERLALCADPLFSDVLAHLLENPLRYGAGRVSTILVTYRDSPGGLDLAFQDDGPGIPGALKEEIFRWDAGGHAGIGLFICRQIAAVTGMTIHETGVCGTGARFVIHVPPGIYRIEGMTPGAPVDADPPAPRRFAATFLPGVTVRELRPAEFPLAERLWTDYHNTKGDIATDRIFAAFREGRAVALGRCRRHPDGLEVDGIFTPAGERGQGYAGAVVRGLVEACGEETLYMHAVLGLERFYGAFGFVPIEEKELPRSIRERFAWAGGEMEGANVRPMRRPAGGPPVRERSGSV